MHGQPYTAGGVSKCLSMYTSVLLSVGDTSLEPRHAVQRAILDDSVRIEGASASVDKHITIQV